MFYGENVTFLTTSQKERMNGIAFPPIAGTGGFFSRTGGIETILSGLKQLILTSKGERVMLPGFGTSLRKYVFEPYTVELRNKISQEILEAISIYEPRVIVKDLSVIFDESVRGSDRNSILVSLRIAVKGDILNEKILDLIV
jgi:phage baseplate assembly protein W